MRRMTLGAAASLLAVACTTTVGTQPTLDSTSSAATGSTTTSTTATPTTANLAPQRDPVAWIAPSGVHLVVLDASDGVIEVLTPCGDAATLTDGSPIFEVDVVIDPGHGGPVDTGAVASTGLAEKEINLKIALALHDFLAERGVASLLTRTGDYPIPIPTRADYADLTNARALISIHHNAPEAPASEIPGIEVFVQQRKPESQRLGGLLYDSSMAALGQFEIDWDRAPDAGVMTVINPDGEDAYGMVRLPETPSALIELGYIANPAEARLYQDPDYVPAAAAGLADAIVTFLTTEETGSGLGAGREFDPRPGVGRDQCVEPDLELALYPDVISAEVTPNGDGYSISATLSSPYDTPERYADAFRVIGDDGVVYGVRELLHDHASEQPFTRSLGPLEIPAGVSTLTVEGRDRVYGWGGATVTVALR